MEDLFTSPDNFTIVSGGQSGADQAGLDWAIRHQVAYDGWCPKGHKTEDGTLAVEYLLCETPTAYYLQRTEWNVRDSDVTLIFTLGETLQGGSKRTAEFAEKLGKPWLHIRPGVHPKFVARFLNRHALRRLNIAGSRESTGPGVSALVQDVLSASIALGSVTAPRN